MGLKSIALTTRPRMRSQHSDVVAALGNQLACLCKGTFHKKCGARPLRKKVCVEEAQKKV
jgi:hypothetical protein